jgi:hypothetical protein
MLVVRTAGGARSEKKWHCGNAVLDRRRLPPVRVMLIGSIASSVPNRLMTGVGCMMGCTPPHRFLLRLGGEAKSRGPGWLCGKAERTGGGLGGSKRPRNTKEAGLGGLGGGGAKETITKATAKGGGAAGLLGGGAKQAAGGAGSAELEAWRKKKAGVRCELELASSNLTCKKCGRVKGGLRRSAHGRLHD